MTFTEQLIVTVVDKALIGALLLLGGFYLNKVLERFKGQQSLSNELSKLKNSKHLEYLDRQLSQFYWPIYMRLHSDNAVWERILDKLSEDEFKRRVGLEVERTFILPNHEEVIRILQSNIHLMEDDGKLFKEILKYVRHVSTYRAIREAGCHDKDPLDLDEPWPEEFLPTLEKTAFKLQKEYDGLIKSIEA